MTLKKRISKDKTAEGMAKGHTFCGFIFSHYFTSTVLASDLILRSADTTSTSIR